jgi:hypothetical protein
MRHGAEEMRRNGFYLVIEHMEAMFFIQMHGQRGACFVVSEHEQRA